MPSEAAELRDLSDDQLLERVESAKEELFNLRFQLATGQLDNPSRIRKVRREIARAATVLREREIEAERETAPAAETSAAGTEGHR
jgi:large subunit ribosomal protein L29